MRILGYARVHYGNLRRLPTLQQSCLGFCSVKLVILEKNLKRSFKLHKAIFVGNPSIVVLTCDQNFCMCSSRCCEL